MRRELTEGVQFQEIQEVKEMHDEEKQRLKTVFLFLLPLILLELFLMIHLVRWIGAGWTLAILLMPKLLWLLGTWLSWHQKMKNIAAQVKVAETTHSRAKLDKDEHYKRHKKELETFQLSLKLILIPSLILTLSVFTFNLVLTTYIIHQRKMKMKRN